MKQMKIKKIHTICMALLLTFLWSVSYAQDRNDISDQIVDREEQYYPTKGFRSIRGEFLFRLGNELIYVNKGSSNKRGPSHSIKAINMRTKERTLIDRSSTVQCVKCGRNTMLYIKNGTIMRWNANSRRATVYRKIKRTESLKGIGFNADNSSLLLVLKEKKSKSWICRLLDKSKRIVMNDTLNMDTIPHENIQPKIGYVNNHFAISVKNSLFTLNCNKLELKLLSRKCLKYLLDSYYVLYYQRGDSTELDSYYYFFKSGEIAHINSVLNEDMAKSNNFILFQARVGDKHPFPKIFARNEFMLMYDDIYWYGGNNIIYKDNSCIVIYKMRNRSVNKKYFQWKSLKR